MARVVVSNKNNVIVVPSEGDHQDKLFRFPPSEEVKQDQPVILDIHDSWWVDWIATIQ